MEVVAHDTPHPGDGTLRFRISSRVWIDLRKNVSKLASSHANIVSRHKCKIFPHLSENITM
jgi:hypothetical protein